MVGFLDKLVHWRSKIVDERVISATVTLIKNGNPECPITLKFSYPGNLQYHKLSRAEARLLSAAMADAIREGNEQ